MKNLEYKTQIKARPEKIWETLWNQETYRIWSGVMNEGARFEGNWEEDSLIDLYDAKNNGMYNLIKKNIPNRQLTMQHKGWIYDGVRDDQGWEDSRETYLLTENEQGTELKISVNSLDEFEDFFNSNYPKVLEKVKKLAESE